MNKIGMKELVQVKEFNRRAQNRWQEDVDNWEFSKGGMPNLCMYLFLTPEGNKRQKGWVYTDNYQHHSFGMNKEKAKESYYGFMQLTN